MSSPTDRFEDPEPLGTPTDHALVGKARDMVTGQVVAVKMRRPGDTIRRRFAREVADMRSAAGRHVMPILAVDDDGDWYSMPLASHELTRAHNGLGTGELERLAVEVASAVAEALRDFHGRGQVHRDLKPANILWLEDRWVVSDFGIARNEPGSTTSQFTYAGGPLGTLGWAAPELLIDAHGAVPASDVYSLGVIVAWIVDGKTPTVGVAPAVGGRFASVVARATRHEPGRRFADIDEMIRAMNSATTGGGSLSTQLERLLGEPLAVSDLTDFALAHRDNETLMLEGLTSLDFGGIRRWASSDPESLAIVTRSIAVLLADERTRGGLQRDRLIPPLRWVLQVTKELFRQGQVDLAEELTVALFEAAEACDRFKVSNEIGRWVKTISIDRTAAAVIRAADSSTATAYARNYVENDWSNTASSLIRRWLT